MIKKILDPSKNQYVWIVLLIGLIHGLTYIFLIPPWQHYDEPGHFEYAWMIANNTQIPKKGEFDNQIRSEILESMKRNDFFEYQNIESFLENVDQIDPVWIGIPQVGDPPLYYILTSLPIRILKNQTIEFQLYATRFISLILYLLILITAVYFSRELYSPAHPGRLLFPLSLCLIPSFVDHMTALNNDVAAVLINSLILLFGIRLIKYRLNWMDSCTLIFLGSLVYFVKASIWLSLILIIIAFLLSLSNKKQRIALGISLIFFIISIISIFQFEDVAFWYKNSKQTTSTSDETLYGNVFYLSNDKNSRYSSLTQTIPPSNYSSLAGEVVTLGGEVWGEKENQSISLSLRVLSTKKEIEYLYGEKLLISSSPQFTANHIQLPEDFDLMFVELRNTGEGDLYFKNLILVLGEYPTNIEPNYYNSENSNGIWHGRKFKNIIRNGSASRKWISFKPEIVNIMERFDPRLSDAANRIIYSLDVQGTAWFLKASAARIFRSFWAVFGWGNIHLIGANPYRLPLLFTFISAILTLFILIKQRSKCNFRKIFWFCLAIILSVVYAWFTGISMNSIFVNAYFPVARFVYPAIFPVLFFIIHGWVNILNEIKFFSFGLLIYLLILLYLDLLSIITLFRYF